MTRSRLDYEHLRRVHPNIIVLSMAMAGQNGPLQHLRGFAPIATSFAGLENMIGYPDVGPKVFPKEIVAELPMTPTGKVKKDPLVRDITEKLAREA